MTRYARARAALFAVVCTMANAGCVTDPLAEKTSSHVRQLRKDDSACRGKVQKALDGSAGEQRAVYYFGKLPREDAQTIAILLAEKPGAARLMTCRNADASSAKPIKLAAGDALRFRKLFEQRYKGVRGREDTLALAETSSAALVVLNKGAKATEYWLPKHMEKEFNDLFYDALKQTQ